MPTNPNMVAIQTVTVPSGGAASIEFTSIPQTYTDLLIKVSARSTTGGGWSDAIITFNGGTTYSSRYLYGDSTAANSGNSASQIVTRGAAGNSTTANTFGNTDIYIPNYAGNTKKSVSIDDVTENNSGAVNSAITHLLAGLSDSTTAINSVTLTMGSGNFVQYSTATLYGVTSAATAAKATGGIITMDENYFYHTFLASGTFTPTQSITADCLVVAGGGGGGGPNSGGGGGAGGLLYSASESLTATGYTVTVGAGGVANGSLSGTGTNGSNSQFGSITASVGGGGGCSSLNAGGGFPNSGASGGSGGGAGNNNSGVGGAGTAGQGFAGGNGGASDTPGGGGGAGAAGTNGMAINGDSAAGGSGLNTYSSFATATSTGSGGYYAGGGCSGGNVAGGVLITTRSNGGGGFNSTTAADRDGLVNTGSGGAGWTYNGGATNYSGGAGGSGIVIVRYAK